ncbi:DoxX family membrane protein [Streptomyces sp. NPDC048172]|uniref:DoxX family protein n=1 Tax=Streptomyces sp. NPDC048172 TaxID=3365505 RepID=UPI00370F7816
MSVDTRTPRAGAAGPSGFFDDEPVLSTVKVPSDPAEVVVNHASFRVRLGPAAASGPARPHVAEETQPMPAVATAGAAVGAGAGAAVGAGAGAAAGGRRRTPVVWSGRAEPDDTGATRLVQAVRTAEAERTHGVEGGVGGGDATATQVLPQVGDPVARPGSAGPPTGPATVVGPPRGPQPSEAQPPLLSGVRPARGAFDEPFDEPEDTGEFETLHGGPGGPGSMQAVVVGPADADGGERRRGDSVRHGFYPDRRMNLGVVLLPLRVFLGFITVYAGMGKLCDPVYFDGGERGSMVTWLRSLDPWAIASPLRDFALAHPVGAGLTVAFLQVIVGVLTMFGLWQRLAASFGALLSVALLLTVSWSSVPVYDAPDIIYLAAWSPLIIAGAPVYSVDARLAGDAWRKLGPRVPLWDLRRRVLRRGTVLATLIVGCALLIGSLLGSAVRSSQVATVPRKGETPTNQLPGSPLPKRPGASTTTGQASQGPGEATGSPEGTDSRRKTRPSSRATQPGDQQRATTGPETTPSQQQETTTSPAQRQTAPPAQEQPAQPEATSGGSAGPDAGSAARSTSTAGSGGGTSSSGGSSSGGGGDSGGGGGRTLGGLLGGQ